MRIAAFLLLLASLHAAAQYSGPAVETCLKYAEREIRQSGNQSGSVVFERDHELVIARTTRKMGSQFVSSTLFGNGAIVNPTGAPIEMSFVCLLADDQRALFFAWLPRRDAPVLAQCRRSKNVTECLDYLLIVAERDLTEVYSAQLIRARQADAGKGETNSDAFLRSTNAFKAYRDAECARRAATSAASGGGGDARKACEIELTRRRALDFR